jgi:hypothetical protein
MNPDDDSFTSEQVPESVSLVERVRERAPKSPSSKMNTDDEEEDDESIDNSEDDDDEDDSIVAPDDEIEEEEGEVPDDTEDTLKAHAEVLKAEAEKFIKKELVSDVVGGRTLRKRAEIKKPDDSHHRIIAAAFLLDEKKEIIKECNIWKKKLAAEASSRNVVFPRLDVKMSLEVLKAEHDKIRIALGLESSSSEEDSEEEEDEDSSASEDEDDEDDDSEDSMEEDD